MNELINSNDLTMSNSELIDFMKSDEMKGYENLPKQAQIFLVKGVQMTLLEEGIKTAERSNFNPKCLGLFGKDIIPSKVTDYIYMSIAGVVGSVSKSRKKRGGESYYHKELALSFEKYLPEYSLLSSEMKISKTDTDRIDLYARCKETHKDVIIELKLGAKSAHKQLRSYAWEFDEPILVNISEQEVKTKREGIRYLTFNEIGLYAQSQIKTGEVE